MVFLNAGLWLAVVFAFSLSAPVGATDPACVKANFQKILRPGESNQILAHKQITHDLYNGEVTSIRRFSENDNKGELFIVTIKGNPDREALFKPRRFGDGDGWARTPMEYVAYHLNQKLGMDYVPPTAYRRGISLEIDGQTLTEGAFMFKAPDYQAMMKLSEEKFPALHTEVMSDHRILSVLLQNGDGHHRNLGLGKHWVDGAERPVFVDWNASLRKETNVFVDNYPAYGNHLPVTKVRQGTLENLRKLSAEDFNPLIDADFITRDEVKGIIERRDRIIKYFEELAAKDQSTIISD